MMQNQSAHYANYLAQERQRHNRDQMQEAQRALQQRGPNGGHYVQQHPSNHQRHQIHKTEVRNQQPTNGYGAHNIPGAVGGMKENGGGGAQYDRKSGKSRKSSSQKNKGHQSEYDDDSDYSDYSDCDKYTVSASAEIVYFT